VSGLDSTAIIVTAFARPAYLERTLSSWQNTRGIRGIHSVTLALGHHPPAFMDQLRLYDSFRRELGLGARGLVKPDSAAAKASNGMHRAIAEAANWTLARNPDVEFLIFGEEDLIVSSDVLEYFSWAREQFAEDERVLAVCSHSPGGQGWDPKGPIDDGDADQETVRLLPGYFQAWVFGTWQDRWEKILKPSWDYDCNKGGPLTSGWDWGVLRTVREGGYFCVVPDASRSQNIGRDGGWAANPADFPNTQAASFREHREPVAYRLIEAEERAA
jgi:hypothetical protein